MLQVAVVLTNCDNPSPGECRFLEAIGRDDRFGVTLLSAGKPNAARLPGTIAALLALERATLGFLQNAPKNSCSVGPVLPLDQFPELRHTPDVIVDFSWHDAVEKYARSAPYGVWRLDAYTGAAGLMAAFQGDGATPVALLRYSEEGRSPDVMARAVYDTKTLAAMNAHYIQEKSVQLIERELARVTVNPVQTAFEPGPPPPVVPGIGALGRYTLLVCGDVAARMWRALKARMGLRPRMFTLRVGRGELPGFDPAASVEIKPVGNSYWADPFLFENDGEVFLFYEDFRYDIRRGHISVGKLNGTDFQLIGPALTAPHHLSFPFVFRRGDDIFMLPETHQAGRLEIWRATDFPTGWELYSTALDGVGAVDSVLKEIDDTWWLFTNICRDSFNDHCSELHIFRTNGPEMTQIEPHRLNPVVIGSDQARGGGRVFRRDGRWFRSSQDNSGGVYGYGLNIMEIEELDIEHYRERRVRHITPDFTDGLIGCHQLDAAAGVFVIDTRKP